MAELRRLLCLSWLFGSSVSLNFSLPEENVSVSILKPSAIKIINQYFSKTDKITVADECQDLQGRGWRWLKAPCEFHNKIDWTLKRNITGSMSGYWSNKGGLVCILDDSQATKALTYMGYRNPLARQLLIVGNLTKSKLPEMFEHAWKSMKSINVMIVSGGDVYLYNPFTARVIDQVSTENVDEIVTERLKNLQHYPLRVNMFDCIQLCNTTRDSSYLSACGEILNVFQRFLNFTPKIVPPYDIADFGYVATNGTFVGALGEIEYDRAEFSTGLRLITNYNNSRNIYFLHPCLDLSYKFVVPINFYNVDFEVMPHKFMDVPVILLVSITITLLICLHFWSNRIEENRSTFAHVVILYVGAYINASMNFKPISFSTKILYSLILLMALILSNLYQGSIIMQLNKSEGNANIQTLDQLLRSGLQIRVPSGPNRYIQDFRDFPKKSLQYRLFKQMEVTDTMSEPQIVYAAFSRNAAIMCPNHFLYHYQSKYLSNRTGRPLIHIVPEASYEYYATVMVQKSSPFIERLNFILERITESGLIRHQYEIAILRYNMASIRLARNGLVPVNEVKLIGMKEMTSFFKYYLMAMGFSVLVFVLEFLANRLERKLLIWHLRLELKKHDSRQCEICFQRRLRSQHFAYKCPH